MKMLGVGAVSALVVAGVMAQTSTTVTTNAGGTVTSSTSTTALSGTGTISAYTPGSDYITFRGERDAAPARYYYTKETPIVDSEGHSVEWSAIRSDMPVNYSYVREGDWQKNICNQRQRVFFICQS